MRSEGIAVAWKCADYKQRLLEENLIFAKPGNVLISSYLLHFTYLHISGTLLDRATLDFQE